MSCHDGFRFSSLRQFTRKTAPLQAAVEGVVATPEVHNITNMAFVIEDAPVATLNPGHCMDETHGAFLTDMQLLPVQIHSLQQIQQ